MYVFLVALAIYHGRSWWFIW